MRCRRWSVILHSQNMFLSIAVGSHKPIVHLPNVHIGAENHGMVEYSVLSLN